LGEKQVQTQFKSAKAAEYAALQTLRECVSAPIVAKPLECAVFPRFGITHRLWTEPLSQYADWAKP